MSENKGKKIVVIIGIIAAVVLAALFILGAPPASGLKHYKDVFGRFIGGDQRVGTLVAWEEFEAFGLNVADTYAGFKSKEEKAAYSQAFLKQIVIGFKNAGGDFDKFINWRVEKQDSSVGVAVCDYPEKNQVLYLTFVLRQGAWKLQSLRWGNAAPAPVDKAEKEHDEQKEPA